MVMNAGNNQSSRIPIDTSIEVPDNNFNQIIQNWVTFAKDYHLDGIDVDYEAWYPTEYTNSPAAVSKCFWWSALYYAASG